jgi:hypothetical protein
MHNAADQGLSLATFVALQQRGCVYVIGLGEIKNQFGVRWDRRKEMVWTRLDNLLRQKLGPTDLYVRINDLSYLVSLPSARQEEAEVVCLRIAHDLHAGLLGDCRPADLQVSRITRFHEDTIETVPVGAADDLSFLPEDDAGPPGEDLPLPPTGWRRSNEIEYPEVDYRFVPIWDARKEVVSSYRCAPQFDSFLASHLPAVERAKFDLAVILMSIRHCAEMLSPRRRVGGKFMVWIPVPFDVLCAPLARTEISALCRNLASGLRPYVVFEIADLPYGVPQSRLLELTGALKPFCRGVVAHLPARIANYGAYLGVGLQAIGLSLSARGAGGTDMESEIFKLCAAARRQNIMCFVFDVPGEEVLQSARALGVNLFSGSLIGAPLEAPAPARRLRARDICKSLPEVSAA